MPKPQRPISRAGVWFMRHPGFELELSANSGFSRTLRAWCLGPITFSDARRGMAGGLIVLEEHRRINPKAFCDPSNIIDGHVTLGPFDGAEVRAVDPAFKLHSNGLESRCRNSWSLVGCRRMLEL